MRNIPALLSYAGNICPTCQYEMETFEQSNIVDVKMMWQFRGRTEPIGNPFILFCNKRYVLCKVKQMQIPAMGFTRINKTLKEMLCYSLHFHFLNMVLIFPRADGIEV